MAEDEELAALRADEARCVRRLAACRRFAVNAGGAAGYYATLGQNEEVLLRSFEEILAAHASPDGRYDHLLAERYHKAGLTPADVRVLQERLLFLQQADEDEYTDEDQ
ncbi:hypothetical protein [Dictyobacter arantiisoli]|uniref:Uncharacterized protein n=1 Tax=Dictyobacter arantiisoli TaxID=2014874 RepID=A0A5A5TDB7_9CHLR|nr:hypothetical protein [Dictyobacter arantiisoli]GCF09530.1 hypothetical protein KDI_30940 [Dictyobacter arantiisoli]